MHDVPTTRVHAETAQCGQGQHRGPLGRIGLDQEVVAIVVSERKFREPDDEVPSMVMSLGLQSRQRGLHVLTCGREGLADHLDVPGPWPPLFGGCFSIRRAINVGLAGSATSPTRIGSISAPSPEEAVRRRGRAGPRRAHDEWIDPVVLDVCSAVSHP